MLEKKPKGKYVEGHEPWTIKGVKENTFHAQLKAEGKAGLFNGPAHQAKQRALDITAGTIVPDPVETPAPAPAELTSAVEGRPTISDPPEPVTPAQPADTPPNVIPPPKRPVRRPGRPTETPGATRVVPGEPAQPEPEPAPILVPNRPAITPPDPLPSATGPSVFVSFRCPAAVHDRMREMAHDRRMKLQGIVAAAVEAYLSQNGF